MTGNPGHHRRNQGEGKLQAKKIRRPHPPSIKKPGKDPNFEQKNKQKTAKKESKELEIGGGPREQSRP